MDRRRFIKNMLITAAGSVIIGTAAGCNDNKLLKGDRKMKNQILLRYVRLLALLL